MTFRKPVPLLEAIEAEELSADHYGAYLILVKQPNRAGYLPYYVGKGWIRERLCRHVTSWLGGAYSIWDINKVDTWGAGVTTYQTVKEAGDNVLYAYFPGKSNLQTCYHELSQFVAHCAASARTFVQECLYVSYLPLVGLDEEMRSLGASYAEGKMIEEFAKHFRLANGRKEAMPAEAGIEQGVLDAVSGVIDEYASERRA